MKSIFQNVVIIVRIIAGERALLLVGFITTQGHLLFPLLFTLPGFVFSISKPAYIKKLPQSDICRGLRELL